MNKKHLRNILRLVGSLLFCWLYIFHFIFFYISKNKDKIIEDLKIQKKKISLEVPLPIALLCLLHTDRYFRSFFYYRIGPLYSLLISWLRPGDRYFIIAPNCIIAGGVWFAHPYSTIINAESIGKNFNFIHLVTIGQTAKGKPVIGDNVTIGAAVSIFGNVRIGNNVTIGAGSVVTKDIPDNCIAVGNPAKVIRQI